MYWLISSPQLLARWLLLCGALLAADAAVEHRCTEVVEGLLEGEPVALEPPPPPAGERRHSVLIPINETCGAGGVAGLVVTACDALPPQVEVLDGAGQEWAEARVLRLGPTWPELLIHLTVFCETTPTSPTTAAPTGTPSSPVTTPGSISTRDSDTSFTASSATRSTGRSTSSTTTFTIPFSTPSSTTRLQPPGPIPMGSLP